MSLHNDLPNQEEPRREMRRSCLFIAISSFVIISLLATSVASLIWFVAESRSENNEPPIPTRNVPKEESSVKAADEAIEEVISEVLRLPCTNTFELIDCSTSEHLCCTFILCIEQLFDRVIAAARAIKTAQHKGQMPFDDDEGLHEVAERLGLVITEVAYPDAV